MLGFKKTLQKHFKSIVYSLFKILYGKIEDVINPENAEVISTNLVNKNDKFLYKIYKIENGRLYTDRVNNTAIIKNNKIIDGPSFQFRTIDSNVINTNVRENLALINGTPRLKKNIEGSVLSLLTGGAGNENYWHWMFDVLPRLGIYESKINLDLIDFFLLPDNKKKFQIETLEILGIQKKKQISSIKYRHISTKNLYVTSHPVLLSNNATKDIQNMPKWISTWLKKKFLTNNTKDEKKFYKKIYLDRSDSKSNVKSLRLIVNEEEVKNHLRKEGFKIVKLADLHFNDQVLTFNNAEVIVGLHGAGFTNIVFCKPNAKVIELSANPLDHVIKSLAIKNNLVHKLVSCDSNGTNQHNQFGHIKVSIEELDKIIKA